MMALSLFITQSLIIKKNHLEIPHYFREKIFAKFSFLYDDQTAKAYMPELERICKVYYTYRTEEIIENTKSFDLTSRDIFCFKDENISFTLKPYDFVQQKPQ